MINRLLVFHIAVSQLFASVNKQKKKKKKLFNIEPVADVLSRGSDSMLSVG